MAKPQIFSVLHLVNKLNYRLLLSQYNMRENTERTDLDSKDNDNESIQLPEEMWLHILSFMSLKELTNPVLLVNTQLRRLANELIWEILLKPFLNGEYQQFFRPEFGKSATLTIRAIMQHAATKADIETIKYAIEKKLIDVNAPLGREQQSLLYLAARHQKHELVKFLLDKQADPELPLAKLIKEEAQLRKTDQHQQLYERRLANQRATPECLYESSDFSYFNPGSSYRSHASMINSLLTALENRKQQLRGTQLTKEVVAQNRDDLLKRLFILDREIITRTDSSNHKLLYKAVSSRKGTVCAQFLLGNGAEIDAEVLLAAILKSNSSDLVQKILDHAGDNAVDLVKEVMPLIPTDSKMLSLLQPYTEGEKMSKKRKSPEVSERSDEAISSPGRSGIFALNSQVSNNPQNTKDPQSASVKLGRLG